MQEYVLQKKVKVAQAVSLGSGTQPAPGVANAKDLANQRAIAAGLNPVNHKSKRKAVMSHENQNANQAKAGQEKTEQVSTEVQVDQVETVNQEHAESVASAGSDVELPNTGLDQVDFSDEESVELDSEESVGSEIDEADTDFIVEEEEEAVDDEDEDAPDGDEYETDTDEVEPSQIFEEAKYSALMPNYASHTLAPSLVVTFNLTSPELFDGLKGQLSNVEVAEDLFINYWSPFQRAKTDNDPIPAYAKPLRQVMAYLSKLPEEQLRVIAPDLFGDQVTEMLSTHTGQVVQWKLLNTHCDIDYLDIEGIVITEDGDEDNGALLEFNELIDAEGYSAPQSDNGLESTSNNVVNVSMQIPGLYAAQRPDVMAGKLIELIDRMRGELPTTVSFAFNSDSAVSDPDLRTLIDSLLEEGFTAVSRESLENSLGDVALLPEEINPSSSEALDTLFLHGGDLLLVRSLTVVDESELEDDEE